MTIPESVQLLGVTVPVLPFEQVTKEDKKTHGLARFSNKTIYLADVVRGQPVPQAVKEHTFFHELLHQILNIDLVAGLLHQALAPHMK
jgi:hypothetical protein